MASTKITRTQVTGSTNGTKIFTISVWFKLATVSTTQSCIWSSGTGSTDAIDLHVDATNQLTFESWDGSSNPKLQLSAKLRDCGAWYHVVMTVDSTESVSTDRLKMWLNGVQQTEFGSSTYPTLNYEFPGTGVASDVTTIGTGTQGAYTGSYFNGSMSHFHFIEGTAYDASTFGETDSTSGIWKIKTSPSVTYGNNGFFLKMEDRTNLDLDSSPNALTFTTTGTGTATYDNPSNNFCTLNPLGENVLQSGSHDLLDGNTTFDPTDAGHESWTSSTLGASAGKWYWEVKIAGTMGGDWPDVGFIKLADVSTRQSSSSPPQHNTSYLGVYEPNGTKWIFGTQTTSWGSGYAAGDIIQCAVDCDNGKLWFGKNGTWETSASTGDPANGTNPSGTFTAGTLMGAYVSTYDAGSVYLYCNFGNGYFGTTAVSTAEADGAGIGAFEYAPPTGFYALCTKNIKAYGG